MRSAAPRHKTWKAATAVIALVSCATLVATLLFPYDVSSHSGLELRERISPATAAPLVVRRRESAPEQVSTEEVNGVILFLAGGRWDSYFVRECLPRLELYFLACHKSVYPVHIFHENLPGHQRSLIRSKIPSARRTDFEDVSSIWKQLPKGVTEELLSHWMNSGLQRKFQGRGYRIMCRFWHGLVWRLESLKKYDYYWRLDTDSILTGPPKVDPFVAMKQRGCDYGFNRLKGENPHVAVGLWDAFLAWAKSAESGLQPDDWSPVYPRWLETVKTFAVDPATKAFWAPMYYNNFELGSMRLKQHPLYMSWFEFVDSKEPFGTFRYRWGDAPLHTLGVEAVLAAEEWTKCNFTKADVGYRHAAERPGPILALNCSSTV